jgi:hypothetical protein
MPTWKCVFQVSSKSIIAETELYDICAREINGANGAAYICLQVFSVSKLSQVLTLQWPKLQSCLMSLFNPDLFNSVKDFFSVVCGLKNKEHLISLKLLHLKSHNSRSESAHFLELNFCFSPLSFCRSVSTSWRLYGAFAASKEEYSRIVEFNFPFSWSR